MSSRSAILLLLPVMLVAGCDRKSPAPEQANSVQANTVATTPAPDEVPASSASATAPGKVAPDYGHRGESPPAISFTAPDGKPTTLAAFKGKPLLVNLWATWCAPCVAEMPTLDAAAKANAGKVTVIAVSQDLDAAKVGPFFAAGKFAMLKPYHDPKLGLSLAFQANLPMTILYDSAGKEVWRLTGGMDWTSAEAKALIAKAS